ncbi:MAG: aminotransferase class V-fold PLP-dependent enzyme [Coriobacteriales bacterium]
MSGAGGCGVWSEERVRELRAQFPILERQVNGHPLVYLDNAATAQVPRCVADALAQHLCWQNANIHRGAHALGEEATAAFEDARAAVARYLRAPREGCVVFTSGATQGVNLVARGLEERVGLGSAVLVSALEHHSNYLPWLQLCQRTGAELRVAPLDEHGEVCAERFGELLADGRVRICALTACSNVTGGVTQLEPLVQAAHRAGALVLVDAAQAARALCPDVAVLGCDYLVLSGHKMCAPTGVGVLYGTVAALEELQVTAFGGGMVDEIEIDGIAARYSALPERLEAGTPNIAGAVALGCAAEFLEGLGRDALAERELELTRLAAARLAEVPGVAVLGSPRKRCGAVSIVHSRFGSYDLGQLLDAQGIATRSGRHCAIPAMRQLGAESALRVSPAFYNTAAEVEACAVALERAIHMLERY